MLSFLVTYCKAYDEITGNRDMNLRKYKLSPEEWKIVEDLTEVLKVCQLHFLICTLTICTFLQVFKDATLFFLCLTPNLVKVIPAMDHINSVLAIVSLDNKYELSIQGTLTIGKNILNKYYDWMDHSEVYRISMGQYLKFIQRVSQY